MVWLGHVSETETVKLNIPIGLALVHALDAEPKPIRFSFLGDPEHKKAIGSICTAGIGARLQMPREKASNRGRNNLEAR